MEQNTQTITDIANKTNNDILLLVIILILGLCIVVPSVVIYIRAKSSDKHQRHKELMERESESRKREEKLLEIIQGNTSALTELTTLLKTNNQNCVECRAEQSELYQRILDKQDNIHIDITKIKERM